MNYDSLPLEPLLHQITLLSPINREVPPVLQWSPEAPVPMPKCTHCTTWFYDPTRFTGTLDAFVKIVRHEGTRTLWSGLPATLVMTVPATAIYFTAYDHLKAFLCGQALTSNLYAPMVAVHWAHLGTVTVIGPLALVWIKLQAQHVSYRKLGTCVGAAVAQGGWRSLWLVWGPTAL